MSMRLAHLTGLIMAAISGSISFLTAQAATPLVFNSAAPANNLQGSLAAEVLFAQSQVMPIRPRNGDSQLHLIGQRRCLLLVRPLKTNDTTPVSVTARNGSGKTLGSINLNPPDKLPKTAYYLEGVPDDVIDFTPGAGTTHVVNDSAVMNKLSDPSGAFLLENLRQNALVEIQTANGQWVREIYLPAAAGLDGKIIRITSEAAYGSTVNYSGRQVELSTGQKFQFKCVRGQWVRDGELENNGLVYANDAWSAVLPAEWIVPGLNLQFNQDKLRGELARVNVGAPTELLIHTIDIGMLTTPRNDFKFAADAEAHREYFQTVPASRLIISQYAPLLLSEVMLPTGTLLTDRDPGKGGWHDGTMRQYIGKELISLGIDNANYGINSTAGAGEGTHPYIAAQLVAHNSRGNYANGIVVHGGSGGGGIVTLDASLGNEFSHEVGHNFGLGHYEGGFNGSVHRSADQINSTWGWDADKNRFIPNFFPTRSGQDACYEGQCQPPFDGRKFGFDAMAGGEPFSSFNRFTLYTPYSAAKIQQFLESKAVFDEKSPTGFSQWNSNTARMEPYTHKIESTEQITPSNNDLSERRMTALLAGYDLVKIAMQDGNWTHDIRVPPAAPGNRGRIVSIEHGASYGSDLFINGGKIAVAHGFRKSYTSDGTHWTEGPVADSRVERKPQAFGIPVTTLVGYYDPAGQLKSYIYPALHGAYGFTYSADTNRADAADTYLVVETANGPLRFPLAKQRLSANVMNKFHVNVPETSQPQRVAVVSRGKILAQRSIDPVADKLMFTVNGEPQRNPDR